MSDRKLTVAVLMGGRATEHDISLKSGTMVVGALDRAKYDVVPVQIRRDGVWLLPNAPLAGDTAWLPQSEEQASSGGMLPDPMAAAKRSASQDIARPMPAEEIVRRGIDVVIVALHGRYGEDGSVQGMLDTLGLPYTGSGVLGSALAMDKVRAKSLIAFAGLRTPAWMVIHEPAWRDDRESVLAEIEREFAYPCVAKIPEEGSSFGMGIPSDRESLAALLDEFVGARGHMMIEEYVRGTEITGSVEGAMPGEHPRALPITEIVPKTAAFFDFEAKYTPGATEEITPARIDAELTAEAQEMSVRAHEILGCGTLSRTDMIVRDRDIYYLETNTIPGMTETSLFPQAGAAVGIGFPELLDRQIELALAHAKR